MLFNSQHTLKRFFKYLSTSMTSSFSYELVSKKIRNCIQDLRSVTPQNLNLTNPFHYLPSSLGGPASLELLGQNSLSNSDRKTRTTNPFSPYYSNCRESNDRHFSSSKAKLLVYEDEDESILTTTSSTQQTYGSSYFYLNCIVEFLIKLFGGGGSGRLRSTGENVNDRLSLVRMLLELVPANAELVKQFVWLSQKANGLHKTVQLFYDHLSINNIDNEHLWIL